LEAWRIAISACDLGVLIEQQALWFLGFRHDDAHSAGGNALPGADFACLAQFHRTVDGYFARRHQRFGLRPALGHSHELEELVEFDEFLLRAKLEVEGLHAVNVPPPGSPAQARFEERSIYRQTSLRPVK